MSSTKSSYSFVTSIFKFSISTWVNALLYLLSILLVNLLVDKAIFGLFDLTIGASTTLMSIVTLGFDHAFLRFFFETPKGIKDSRQISLLGIFISCSLLTITTILVLLIPNVVGDVFFEGRKEPILLISMCLTCLAMVVIRFFNISYRMQNNILKFTIVSVLLQFFTRFFYIFGVFIKNDIKTVEIFNLIGLFSFTCIFFIFERKNLIPKKYEIPKDAYAPLFKYSLGIMPSSVLLWGNQLVNKLFISTVLGDGALGLFSFAALISQALAIIQGGFANFWSAYMFTNHKTDQERIKRVHDLLVFIIMVLMCFLILLSPIVFLVLSRYSESRQVFGLLLYAPLLMIVAETTVYGIEIEKKTILNTVSSLICLSVNILCCVFLIPLFNLAGAAFSLVISTAAMFVFRTIMAQRFYRSITSYLKTTVSLILMLILSIATFIFDSSYFIIAILSSVLLLYYFFCYSNEVKLVVSLLKNLIKKNTPETI